MLAMENFGVESTNKTVGKKYFGKLTHYTKQMASQPNC